MIVVLGAGPAGLAAADELARRATPVTIVDRADGVGGLSRSIEFGGAPVDLGQHFFPAHVAGLEGYRSELLGNDEFVTTQRTRMYWRRQLVGYPPRPAEIARTVGAGETLRIGASLVHARFGRDRGGVGGPVDYAHRARARFGERLFEDCIRGYIEKLWGVPCETLEGSWEAGRLKEGPVAALLAALTHRERHHRISVARGGSGQLFDALADRIRAHGGRFMLGADIVGVVHDGTTVEQVVVRDGAGVEHSLRADGYISTVPLPVIARLAGFVTGRPPRLRSTVLVYLLVCGGDLFPDHSIYVNDPALTVGRVVNFSNWGPAMHQGIDSTVLCAELWCDPGDAVWSADDRELERLVTDELHVMGLLAGQRIDDRLVVRLGNTHPIPELGTVTSTRELIGRLGCLKNLQLAGRAGEFAYRDMDATILSGLRAARNVGDTCPASRSDADGCVSSRTEP